MVYHYTIADRLMQILISGKINIMQEQEETSEDEIMLCWMTINPSWDKTAFYGYPSGIIDSHGRIRISIDKEFEKHHVYRKNIDNIGMLESSAIAVGVNPEDWRVSVEDIPISDFHKIEYMDKHTRKWIDLNIIKKDSQWD